MELDREGRLNDEKTIVLPRASSEDLCYMILAEGVEVVICGGIEEEFYDYLTWKKVRVIDNIIGPWKWSFEKLRLDELVPGLIFRGWRKI